MWINATCFLNNRNGDYAKYLSHPSAFILCLIPIMFITQYPPRVSSPALSFTYVFSMSVIACLIRECYRLSPPWVLAFIYIYIYICPTWLLSPFSSMSVITRLLHECYHLCPPWMLSHVSYMSVITCLPHECYHLFSPWVFYLLFPPWMVTHVSSMSLNPCLSHECYHMSPH